MWSSARSRRATPQQKAAFDACPYKFLVHYSYRHSTGFGAGVLDIGLHHSTFEAEDLDDFHSKVSLITAANMQADGMEFDPSTFVAEITRIDPLQS